MILSCNDIKKIYLDVPVLRNVTFIINENDKAALIGINGAGKTTILRIIMGIETADQGNVFFSKGKTVGYLPQNALLDSQSTVYEEVLSERQELIDLEAYLETLIQQMETFTGDELDVIIRKHTEALQVFEKKGGYTYESEARAILLGLGFTKDDFEQNVNTLSGGQKTRVALAKILIATPDLVILDEPTNHLDMSSITWLENYLSNYKNAVLIVSHDRYFLDKIVNKVIEIEAGNSRSYAGNYSIYAITKEMLRNAEMNAYNKQQDEIEHQKAVISKLRSFNAEKADRRAKSREKVLERMVKIERPIRLNNEMRLALKPHVESGKDVLSVRSLSKAFSINTLFTDVSFEVKRGEHIAIIGDNGTGKTTLLKIINGIEQQNQGAYVLGSQVSVGYYDQEHNVLNNKRTIFQEISDNYPHLTHQQIRNVLATFLFKGDDVWKKIYSLSGGEKGRVSLAKLMLSEANFLIMDEPTNHLDITSKEILEDALNNYDGTVLYVSHDRYFVNRTADKLLELKNFKFTEFIGSYDDYLSKRDNLS